MKKIIATLLVFVFVMALAAGCAKQDETPQLDFIPPTAEADWLRESEKDKVHNPYGNAYRAYSMTQQILQDMYTDSETGGRALQKRGTGYSADIWNFASLISTTDRLGDLYPQDEQLLGLQMNMIEGQDYFVRWFSSDDPRSEKWQGRVYSTQPAARKFQASNVISYDDCMNSAARVFMDYYQKIKDDPARADEAEKTLQKAKDQIDFMIEDAYIPREGIEAFYWCDESNVVSPNVNALVAVEFLRLFQFLDDLGRIDGETGAVIDPEGTEERYQTPDDGLVAVSDEEIADGMWMTDPENKQTNRYLYYARKAYDYCWDMMRDAQQHCYYLQRYCYYLTEPNTYKKGDEDYVGAVHPTFDLSVTGFMIQAHVTFYEFTGDDMYLDRAVEDAVGGHEYFKLYYDFGDCRVNRYVMENVWIGQTYIWGLYELSQYRNSEEVVFLMNEWQNTMDYAYENTLVDNYVSPYLVTGWFENDATCANISLLDCTGAASIYAFLALWEKGIYEKDVHQHVENGVYVGQN